MTPPTWTISELICKAALGLVTNLLLDTKVGMAKLMPRAGFGFALADLSLWESKRQIGPYIAGSTQGDVGANFVGAQRAERSALSVTLARGREPLHERASRSSPTGQENGASRTQPSQLQSERKVRTPWKHCRPRIQYEMASALPCVRGAPARSTLLCNSLGSDLLSSEAHESTQH